MDQIIDKLKTRYHYADTLLNLLKVIIENMIIYLGDEHTDKIIDAFVNTPIKMVKDELDLKEFFKSIGLDDNSSFPIKASGMYSEEFQLDKEGNLRRISYLLIRGEELNDQSIANIVHECCHMVMNYGKATIKDNIIFSKTGLSDDRYELIDGKFVLTLSTNTAIEEGINEYNARKITELVLRRPCNSTAYNMNVSYVSALMDNEVARKIVDQSRLNGDDNWTSILGAELSEKYINAFNDYWNSIFDRSIPRQKKKELGELYLEKSLVIYNEVVEYMKNIDLTTKEGIHR